MDRPRCLDLNKPQIVYAIENEADDCKAKTHTSQTTVHLYTNQFDQNVDPNKGATDQVGKFFNSKKETTFMESFN